MAPPARRGPSIAHIEGRKLSALKPWATSAETPGASWDPQPVNGLRSRGPRPTPWSQGQAALASPSTADRTLGLRLSPGPCS